MITKNNLLSHVNHLFDSSLSEAELLKKLHSLTLMTEWAKKENQITEEEYADVMDHIEKRKREKSTSVTSLIENKTSTRKSVNVIQFLSSRKTLIIILILAVSLTGVIIVTQKAKRTKAHLINPTDVKKEGRTLRFQGTLIDPQGHPIDKKVDVAFHLYTQKNDGQPIYTGQCVGESGLIPALDGSFSISIGSDCHMARIPDIVFSKNQNVYLGIQVGSDKELAPRYPIATVQYAARSDSVKGLTLGTNESSIPYIDEEGHLVIGALSPKLKSTRGDFSIEGQTVSIRTSEESGGSISLEPDLGGSVLIPSGKLGIGKKDPATELDVEGSIGVSQDLYLNGADTSVYQSQGGPISFYTAKDLSSETKPSLALGSENKVGLATGIFVDTITAGGSVSPSESEAFNLGSPTNKWKTMYANGVAVTSPGESIIVPHFLFSALGKADDTSVSSLTNVSKKDTNGTNILRLNLGTPSTGTAARFVDFYAGSTSENTGTKVGSIRLQNGAVVYQTNGADFAEYMEMREPVEEGDIISMTEKGKGKARGSQAGPLIGVISKVAGFIGNADESKNMKNKKTVGLVGQIKTNVSTINGSITPGAYISVSEIPGYGALAQQSGEVIGMVMDSQESISKQMNARNCPQEYKTSTISCGKVTLFVSPRYIDVPHKETPKKDTKGTAIIPENQTSLRVYNSQIKDTSVILLTPISSKPVRISLVEQESCQKKETTCKPYFLVIADKLAIESLKFNWLIVND